MVFIKALIKKIKSSRFKYKFLSVTILSVCLANGYTLNPVSETDKQVDAYFFDLLEQSKNVNYIEALEIAKKIQKLVPQHPAGHIFASAILSWIISDFYNYDYAEEFLDEVDKTIDLAEDMIQDSRKDPWGYVYLGGAYGFRGIYYGVIGSFYFAFVDGVRGNYQLEKAIDLDPHIYDNYFGTGVFDFWRAYYAGKFFWLGTSDRNKQKGIDKIKLAVTKGKYTTLEAEFSLIQIYLVDGRYQDAIDQAQSLLKDIPHSIKGNRFMGIAYRELGQYDKSLETFFRLRSIIENHPLRTPAALLEINMNIAKSYLSQGLIKEALSLLENTLEYRYRIEPENDFLEELLDEYDNLVKESRNKISLNN